jgi:hypothetical protein
MRPAIHRLSINAVRVDALAAGLGPPTDHALMSLLALNELRVSEATGADIEHLGLDRGHRTLTITRIRAAREPIQVFLFFSSRLGCLGSLTVSVILTLILLAVFHVL